MSMAPFVAPRHLVCCTKETPSPALLSHNFDQCVLVYISVEEDLTLAKSTSTLIPPFIFHGSLTSLRLSFSQISRGHDDTLQVYYGNQRSCKVPNMIPGIDQAPNEKQLLLLLLKQSSEKKMYELLPFVLHREEFWREEQNGVSTNGNEMKSRHLLGTKFQAFGENWHISLKS